MGNTLTTIKQYLGYEDEIMTPHQITNSTNDIKRKTLEEQIELLQKQIDQDRDDKVSKAELREYFDQLTNKIDKNTDGVITHDELESYVNDQLSLSNSETEKWKIAYEKLHDEYEMLLEKIRLEEAKVLDVSQISPQALKDYVESEVIQTDANLRLIPDPLERKVYLTVYKTIMKSLEGLFNTTAVDLLNHRISFAIQPIPLDERQAKKTELAERKKGTEKTK